MSDEPLYQMSPTQRFSDRVADYVRFRPDYPESAISAMLEDLGPSDELTIADIGAGTGILSSQLAARSCLVIAVEPNDQMRAAIRPHPRIVPHKGTAERTGLDPQSVGLVVCAQSFHWFNPALALPEFRRILKRTGRLAVMWNTRDVNDPVSDEYTAAIREASDHHPAETRMATENALTDTDDFINLRSQSFPHAQRLSLQGLIGRARSASYCPREGPKFERLVAQLKRAHAAHADADGFVDLKYLTRLHLAKPA